MELVKTETLDDIILVKNNYVDLPENHDVITVSDNFIKPSKETVGTIFNNLAYYGYILSNEAVKRLFTLSDEIIVYWWKGMEKVLKEVTGAKRKMEKFVVYKNFPKEVLDKSEAEYWIAQIFMYLGVPNQWFTQEEKPRDSTFKKDSLKVLRLANENTIPEIMNGLFMLPAKWNKEQYKEAVSMIEQYKPELTVQSIPFKENLIKVVEFTMDKGIDFKMSSATDVVRLGVVLSGGELNSFEKVRFRSFKKKERRYLLNLLENSTSLTQDMARDKEVWKRFLYGLHAGDFKTTYRKVLKAADLLYNDDVHSFSSLVELMFKQKNPEVVNLLSTRPGEFMRRIRLLMTHFPGETEQAFKKVITNLKTIQLLKLKRYLLTINTRKFRLFPPKGNWTKVQVQPNNVKLNKRLNTALLIALENEIADRINKEFPNGVLLDERTKFIKLSSSDSMPYGRGTVFPIPKRITFIRSASYWEHKANGNIWFDNGWNFFTENWVSHGSVCWNRPIYDYFNIKAAAVFSGDPTNSKDWKGRACQMIDLYIDKLVESGVRYAVWNILCYSHVKFSDAKDVFAALQWGYEPEKGKLFEPSRNQIAFQIKDGSLAKYIVYLDLVERKLVYLDANLKGKVQSASMNEQTLQPLMPAIVEYLNTLPSVYDLFEFANEGKTPIMYDDNEIQIKENKAYVFRPLNVENKYEQIDLNSLL